MRSIMLCYNLKGTKKGRKIGMLGSFLGFRVKYVEKEEYSKEVKREHESMTKAEQAGKKKEE